MPTPLTTLGPYRIDRELGRGGMGVVYLGHDTRLDRPVAIKALPPDLAADPDRLARLEREARTLASLSHPNIAGIYGIEEAALEKYLVLEYVDGQTLDARLLRGPMAVDDALEIAGQIALALEAAHEKGVVHRDLKPGNIMITTEGGVKVLDFGLARVAGTPGGRRRLPHDVVPRPARVANDSRRDHGHGRLHVARAGARQARGSADGHLLLRVRPVRAAHAGAAVRRRDGERGDRRHPAQGRGSRPPASRHAVTRPPRPRALPAA